MIIIDAKKPEQKTEASEPSLSQRKLAAQAEAQYAKKMTPSKAQRLKKAGISK